MRTGYQPLPQPSGEPPTGGTVASTLQPPAPWPMPHGDGGPAFPPQDRILVTQIADEKQLKAISQALAHGRLTGMSLRDYFASQALIGLTMRIGSNTYRQYLDGRAHGREGIVAYALADAMLAARDGQHDGDGEGAAELSDPARVVLECGHPIEGNKVWCPNCHTHKQPVLSQRERA